MLYKTVIKILKTSLALNIDGLHGNVNIEGCSLKVILLENETGVINTTYQLNFLKITFHTKANTDTSVIIFISRYAIFLCDSHSRNK